MISYTLYVNTAKIIPNNKHNGEKYFVSYFANSVSFIFLENPRTLNSPIALNIKIIDKNIPLYR